GLVQIRGHDRGLRGDQLLLDREKGVSVALLVCVGLIVSICGGRVALLVCGRGGQFVGGRRGLPAHGRRAWEGGRGDRGAGNAQRGARQSAVTRHGKPRDVRECWAATGTAG